MNVSAENSSHESIAIWEWVCRAVALPLLNALYVFVFFIFVKYKNDFGGSYYALVKALAFGDILVCVYEMQLFFFFIVPGWYYFGHVFGKLFRLLAYIYFWYFNVAIHLIVAVNRFFAIVFFAQYQLWFNARATFVSILIPGLCALAACVPYLAICGLRLKENSTYYNAAEYLSGCDPAVGALYGTLDTVVVPAALVAIGLLSMVSVGVCRWRMKSVSSNIKSSYMREIKLLVQSLALVSFLVIILVVFYAPLLSFLVNVIIAFYSTVNPLAYLALDKRLRNRCMEVVRGSKIVPESQNTASTRQTKAILSTHR